MLKFKEVVERFDKQSDIAEELGMPTSVVSEWVQKLKERSDFMTSITTGTITNTTGWKLKLLKITSIKVIERIVDEQAKGGLFTIDMLRQEFESKVKDLGIDNNISMRTVRRS